jgi:hypothetical protein
MSQNNMITVLQPPVSIALLVFPSVEEQPNNIIELKLKTEKIKNALFLIYIVTS